MFRRIKFFAGYLENRTYVYKNSNEFRPSLFNPDEQALYLSDFKSLEIIAQPGFAPVTAKCTFTNGEESLAKINHEMLKVLQKYLHNKAHAMNEDEIEIPKFYDEMFLYLFLGAVGFPFALYLYRHYF